MSHIYLKIRQGSLFNQLLELYVNVEQKRGSLAINLQLLSFWKRKGRKGDINLSAFYALLHMTQLANARIYRFF